MALASKIIWLLCVVAWYIIRLPHEQRARKTSVATSKKGALEIILLSISLTGLGLIPILYVLTGLFSSYDYPLFPPQTVIGTAVFLASLWLFYRTHKDLGRNWSVTLEVRQTHALITHGVYARVRHPMYSAFFLWAVAQVFLLPNLVAGLSGLIGFGTLFFFRVGREEALMLEAFGEEYQIYMQRTKRIIPRIY